MAIRRSRPRKRYLVRAWAPSHRAKRGEVLVRTMRIETDDPHWAAVELYRLRKQQNDRGGTCRWRYEVLDLGPGGKNPLGEVVEYAELVRRAGSYTVRDRGRRKAPRLARRSNPSRSRRDEDFEDHARPAETHALELEGDLVDSMLVGKGRYIDALRTIRLARETADAFEVAGDAFEKYGRSPSALRGATELRTKASRYREAADYAEWTGDIDQLREVAVPGAKSWSRDSPSHPRRSRRARGARRAKRGSLARRSAPRDRDRTREVTPTRRRTR